MTLLFDVIVDLPEGITVVPIFAAALGVALGWAAVRFRVQSDPMVERIDRLLPQTQCGQCGFPGCRPYAEAIANAGETAERWLIRGGPVIVTLGLAGTAVFMPGGQVLPIMPFVLMLGAGFGLMWGFAIKRVTASAPEGERERASAALPTVQMFGYAVGAAAVGILANALGFAGAPDAATLRVVAFWTFAERIEIGFSTLRKFLQQQCWPQRS